jgi:choline dehydrogenase-like flavoprotein
VPGVLVTHFSYGEDGHITALHADRLEDSTQVTYEADEYALAAGALLSSKIYLDSVYRRTGNVLRLGGLMDNRQIHVPFVTLRMIGRSVDTASYQFHHLAFGLTGETPDEDYVHGQITTLKSAAVHPIVQTLPLDMKSALAIFRSMRAGLAIANVNLSDSRRSTSYISIDPLSGGGDTRLVVHYDSGSDEPARIKRAVGRVGKAIRRMGGFVPPGLVRVLPKGTSVHYAGTLPMSSVRTPLTCAPDCRSHDFANLLLADAVSFPSLPAKNHTFTLMANATRVARSALGHA